MQTEVDQIARALSVPSSAIASLPLIGLFTAFDQLPRDRSYSSLEKVAVLFEEVLKKSGEALQECLARLLLLNGLDQEVWRPPCKVPLSVITELETQRIRIRSALTSAPAGYYDPRRDNFRKDAGILLGRLLPVGAGVVNVGARLWRRPLRVGPFRQRLRFVAMYFHSPRGLGPYFQAHTHTEMLGSFTESGWKAAYSRIADLLQDNPGYKGFCRASWFCDPEVRNVSPRLGYLTKEPVDAGANLFYLGADHSGDALTKSRTRKRLYDEGSYVPKSYMLIWHRSDVLAWNRSRS